MYMPAQIQLKLVKMAEIEPESDVPPRLWSPQRSSAPAGTTAMKSHESSEYPSGSDSTDSAGTLISSPIPGFSARAFMLTSAVPTAGSRLSAVNAGGLTAPAAHSVAA